MAKRAALFGSSRVGTGAMPERAHESDLTALKEERRQLVAEYGDKGQYHPSASMIGGLNPAAQRLHVVRGYVARMEAAQRGPRAELYPMGSGYKWDRRSGLLYRIEFRGHVGRIGRSSDGAIYLVEGEGTQAKTWDDADGKMMVWKTIGQAANAFEKRYK